MRIFVHHRIFFPVIALSFLALMAAGCSSSRSFGANIDDFNADTGLKKVLFFDRDYDYSDVDITVFEGRVLLTGTMRSQGGQARLVENAFKAKNVIQVIDETILLPKTPFKQGLVDGRIDQALKARLLTDRGISSRNYKVAVSGSTVYIIGVARDETELTRTLNHAASTSGVQRVISHVLYQDDPSRHARSHN